MNQSLSEVLRAAADDTHDVPGATGRQLLHRGRRRRARHRVLASLAVLAGAGCVAGMGMLIIPSEPTAAIAAAQIRATDTAGADKILAGCAGTRVEDLRDEEVRTEPGLFGTRAAVITADVSEQGTAAFILGDDPRFYAECHLEPGGGAGSWLHEYRVSDPPGGGQNTIYLGRRSFAYTDRFPPEVAKVRLDLYGGGATTATAVDGFVAFMRAGDPSHITLFDKDGNVLAKAGWASLPGEYDSLLPSARR
jgi:hypothetical protein